MRRLRPGCVLTEPETPPGGEGTPAGSQKPGDHLLPGAYYGWHEADERWAQQAGELCAGWPLRSRSPHEGQHPAGGPPRGRQGSRHAGGAPGTG